ncbi:MULTISPECIES: tRNA (adenosine(37)-N6)-threonylcarbamoyltransferase complex dimerization subunit type 1 TsaB [Paenibacillus]|uniref:tRNA (adenosine(37)-N6)-threonylcarbamoyltransferase complex dimerization subunit type 1 TsaB n=1 Tax=Paenibacillus TaxID=44249 RepID=UPI002FE3C32F
MSNEQEVRPVRRLLAFDTSTSSLAVAVMEDGKLLAERNIRAERNHSAYLIGAIEDALAAAGIAKAALDGVAVGVGPGSYTGARIAVTTAKTLAWALRLPVYGLSSLEALAWGGLAQGAGLDAADLGVQTGSGDHWVIPLVDARRGQTYTALFAAGAGRPCPERMEPDAVRLMSDWTEQLGARLRELAPAERPAGVWFVGETGQHAPAAEALRPLLGEALHVIPYELEGIAVGLAAVRRARTAGGDEVHALEPNYTQLAEAEAKRLRERR